MKTNQLIAFAGALLLAACGPVEKEADVLQKINQEVLANSKAYSTLKESTETIGHRLTGSENGQKAEEYTYNLLKSYGFEDVQYQEFEVEAWSRDTLRTAFKAEGEVDFVKVPSVSLAHSPVSADITGEVYDVGNGLSEDFAQHKEQVKGKVALVYIGLLDAPEGTKNLHRSEKTALAIEAGATGIIFINQVANGVLLTGTASVTGSLIDIPAVCISKEDGLALREKLKTQKVEVRIQMANFSKMIKARNVIATLKGSTLPDEKIIVGGHLDSWDLATGALDNGVGSFAILDMARTFKALNIQPKRSLQFVMFMGEEQGLLGSKYMVEELKKTNTLDQVKYIMNIDMTGNPIGFDAFGRDSALPFFTQAGEKIKAIDTVFTNKVGNKAGLHSDHEPFMLEGIPVIGLVGNLDRAGYGCYHSNCDSFDLISEVHMQNSVRFSSMMLYMLANADTLPAASLSSQETERFLTDQGLKESLILGGSWKW